MLQRQPRLSRNKRTALLKCFCQDKTATMAADDCRVSRMAANRYYRHFRECLFEYGSRSPRFMGEVEIDQAFFGGRSPRRLNYLRKVRARMPRKKIMVIGVLQREGNVYTRIIEKADKKTLMPIIHLICEPGTVIYTDKWRAYTDIGIEEYEHRQTNHSAPFLDRNGNHIGSIESFWSYAKRRLAKFNGLSRSTIPLHIKECEVRYNVGDLFPLMKLLLR